MRSQLTRGVFRALIENRPYIHSQCRRQFVTLMPSRRRQWQAKPIQRRYIFGFSALLPNESPTKAERAAGEDGTKPMTELVHAVNQQSRPPHPARLAHAFTAFIRSRLQVPGKLTQNQAWFLLLTLQHLLEHVGEDPKSRVRTALEPRNLEDALGLLAQSQFEQDSLEPIGEFARLLFQRLCLSRAAADEQPSTNALSAYISVLASSGSAMEALDTVELYWEQSLSSAGVLPWVDVIKGLAREGKESLIPSVLERMDKCGAILDQESHETMTDLLARESNGPAMQAVYEAKIAGGIPPSVAATVAAIKGGLRESMIPWVSSLTSRLPQKPTSETRDVLLLLAAAQGEGVDTVEAKLELMATEDPEIKSTLTISTVNTLLEFAMATNRLDLVQDYASLSERWDLDPDVQTYKIQMDACLRKGDVREAVSLFQRLEWEDLTVDLDDRILNRLLAGLCRTDPSEGEYDVILSLTDKLVEMEGRFDAEVLADLCNLMLHRQDLDGVSSLLRPLIDSYSPGELDQIRDGFIRFLVDSTEPTEHLWQTYELLNMAFPLTPVSVRTRIMCSFFDGGRPDLACLVFGHMRQKEYGDIRPTADTYAVCFQGIARTADSSGLHLVHNMLKLDLEVGLTTRVLNALMLAYGTCGMPGHAMDFFREILHSEEGPSEQTLSIFFRVCESFYNGVEEAMKMMEKLKSLDLQVNTSVYNAYIAALGGHCELEQVADAIRAMESKTGEGPSAMTLGTLYNAIPFQYWKDQAEEWARTAYPDIWAELEKTERKTDEEGNQSFDIDRSMDV